MTPESAEVLFERRGGVGLVTLNRPKALNTLTLGMFRAINPKLAAWAADPDIHVLVMAGAGERAFCAGGDVRALYAAGRGLKGPDDLKRVFFREEYRLVHRLHRYPKPYLALMDGITMGGGSGLSVNGARRVVTDATLFAMPETAIGLFPDVGATRFLNRCPGHIGMYLALTGTRLKAADLLHCGLSTHYVAGERVPELVAALAALDWRRGEATAQLDEVLARFAGDPGPAPIAAGRAAIDRCFGGGSVEEILDALAREGTDWARAQRETMLRASPTSLKIAHRQLTIGRAYEIEDALRLEYRLTQHIMQEHDFFEGVRALLVDKDQSPQWRPPSLAELGEAEIDRYFAAIGENELTF